MSGEPGKSLLICFKDKQIFSLRSLRYKVGKNWSWVCGEWHLQQRGFYLALSVRQREHFTAARMTGLHSTRAVFSTLPSSSCSSLANAHWGHFSVPSPTRNINCSLSRAPLKPLENAAGTDHTGCKLTEDQFFVSCLCVPSLAHAWVVSGQFCGFCRVSGAPLAWCSQWGNLGKLICTESQR